MQDLGYILPESIVRAGWDTRDYAGASITRATNGSIRIYKDDSTTERASASGITDTEDFDGVTGCHFLKIDLSDNTTADFYEEGSEYFVKLVGAVIDGQTVNVTLFRFKIGYGPADVYRWNGSTLFVGVGGMPVVDVKRIRGDDQAGIDFLDFIENCFDPSTNRVSADATAISGDSAAADNAEAFFDGTGYAGTNNVIPTVTTVGSVTGAVGQVTGAVGSVTGNVGGNVNGTVASVVGNVGGNVVGTVASVVGNVGGNVVGSVGSVTARVTANVDQLGGVAQSLTDLKDFADDGYDPATNKIAGAVLVDTLTTYTGNTLQTGDSFAVVNSNVHGLAILKGLIDSITNRIGSFAGTGVNTILGFLKAIASKDAATPSDIGGTFLASTDALEAIRDRGDVAWITGDDDAGPGPYGVVVNVKSGGNNLQSANVRATNGGETYRATTDSSGNVTFSLPADTWNFYVYKANYLQDAAPLTIVVTADDLTGNNVTMTYDPPGQSLTEEDPTMTATFLTMHDLLSHLRSSLGGASGDDKNDNFRQAIRDVFDDFFADSCWAEKKAVHRIQIQEAYSTGTLVFDLTGGASERLITLTNGTFPSWAAYGTLVIGNELYRVTARLSNTTLQLDETFCPTADVAAGTSYVLYQDAYLLPADYEGNYDLHSPDQWKRCWIEPEDWVELSTQWRVGSDFRYTILPDERTPGRWSLRFHGQPSQAASLTFLYEARRRTPVRDGTETESLAGTIAWTNGGTTITGTSTSFDDSMIGCVLRIGTSAQHPTHAAGRYPYRGEHVISAVASATSLTLKTPVALTTASGIKYRVTDPVSLDRMNHLALRKGTEAFYALLAGSSDSGKRSTWAAYQEQKDNARGMQSKRRGRDSAMSSDSGGAAYSVEEQSLSD